MKEECLKLINEASVLPFYGYGASCDVLFETPEHVLFETPEQVLETFIKDCNKSGYGNPDLRARIAFENGYFTFEKYQVSLEGTEEEYETLSELGHEDYPE